MTAKRLTSFTLIYNLGVILWGAFVRASGSGAGCGAHWPLCNGEIVPLHANTTMLIEFSHRLTSGLALLLVVYLFFFIRSREERNSSIRKWANLSLFFMIIEALIGAALVLLGLVADDATPYRVFFVGFHLINSFLLLGSIALCTWSSFYGSFSFKSISKKQRNLITTLTFGFLIVASAGAVTALGDTLFPSQNLENGFAENFSTQAHFLVRLRILHPIFAVILTICIWLFCNSLENKISSILQWMMLLQIVMGCINIALLAPVWMQMLHLLMACITWILLVWLIAELSFEAKSVKTSEFQET